jgi:hypothetical protein
VSCRSASIGKLEEVAKLTISHSISRDNSKFIEAVSGGWPAILSNLKTLLETDRVMMASLKRPPVRAD